MRLLIIVLAVIGILVVLGMYMASQQRRQPKADTQPEVRGTPRPDEFPEPGEASPHRADGSAVPGSRDQRHEHGKP
jgi:hypothetical protein